MLSIMVSPRNLNDNGAIFHISCWSSHQYILIVGWNGQGSISQGWRLVNSLKFWCCPHCTCLSIHPHIYDLICWMHFWNEDRQVWPRFLIIIVCHKQFLHMDIQDWGLWCRWCPLQVSKYRFIIWNSFRRKILTGVGIRKETHGKSVAPCFHQLPLILCYTLLLVCHLHNRILYKLTQRSFKLTK